MRRYFRGLIAAKVAWVVVALAAYLTPVYVRTCMAEDSLYALSANGIDGAEVKLSTFNGKVALVGFMMVYSTTSSNLFSTSFCLDGLTKYSPDTL